MSKELTVRDEQKKVAEQHSITERYHLYNYKLSRFQVVYLSYGGTIPECNSKHRAIIILIITNAVFQNDKLYDQTYYQQI